MDNLNIDKKTLNHIEEICSLSPDQINKIERVCDALENRFNAEAAKESHQKFRILFERAAREWLPFIVYCLTFGPATAVSIWRIVTLEIWWHLVIAFIALIVFSPSFAVAIPACNDFWKFTPNELTYIPVSNTEGLKGQFIRFRSHRAQSFYTVTDYVYVLVNPTQQDGRYFEPGEFFWKNIKLILLIALRKIRIV